MLHDDSRLNRNYRKCRKSSSSSQPPPKIKLVFFTSAGWAYSAAGQKLFACVCVCVLTRVVQIINAACRYFNPAQGSRHSPRTFSLNIPLDNSPRYFCGHYILQFPPDSFSEHSPGQFPQTFPQKFPWTFSSQNLCPCRLSITAHWLLVPVTL